STRLRVSHAFHSPLMEPMLADFRAVARSLSYAAPTLPVVSTLTGRLASAEELTDPDYWVRHVRHAVRFADAVTTLEAAGVTRFVEIGPDGVLTGLAAQSATGDRTVTIATQRRDREEVVTLAAAVGRLWATGAPVDLTAWCPTGRRVELPTYAFQREHHWLRHATPAGDVAAVGLAAVEHPLLGAAVPLPDGGVVLTGRLCLDAQPWLADHAVHGTILLPGTGLVELALRAGDEVGCDTVEELTLLAPLVLTAGRTVHVQVIVGPADASAARALSIRSQTVGSATAWTTHAEGLLVPGLPTPAAVPAAWPPPGATPLDLAGAYARMAGQGYAYGPAFQCLHAAWRLGDDVYAEVALPEAARADGERFGLHPALFDAAMHAVVLGGTDGDTAALPFAWSGVTLHAAGATAVRVHLTQPAPDTLTVTVTDPANNPVASVGSLALRPVSADQLGTAADSTLYAVDWVTAPARAVPAGEWLTLAATDDPLDVAATASGSPPAAVVLECAAPDTAVPAAVRSVLDRTLTALRSWLAADRLAESRLVVLTRGAVPVDGEPVDVRLAPVWGLVRAAQAEHPGRITLVDVDATGGLDDVRAAVALDEPEVVVRDGVARVPRLVPLPAAVGTGVRWEAGGTVLVTGGTSGLGAVLARHLVTAHGVRRLVLASRRGPRAPGAAALRAELLAAGATEVTVLACDLADPAQVTALVDGVPGQWPLTGVLHAAGVADNAVVEALTPGQLSATLGPKADAAWLLHEATRRLPLTAFVALSSAGGLLLAAGQGGYAAANVFLDALMTERRRAGLPGTALAYGLWSGAGMGRDLTEVDLARMRRQGLPALTVDEGVRLFDAGVGAGRAVSVPLRLDVAALATGDVPPMLRALVPVTSRRARAAAAGQDGTTELLRRLTGLPGADRERALVELVREHAAAVLGHPDGTGIDVDRGFLDLGFDSLSGLELRDRLARATGRRLPSMLVFDHPSVAALARHLGTVLFDAEPSTPAPPAAEPAEEDLSDASAAELFDILDRELGAADPAESR
ncbi:SDR family NAD(P)-dependent oxidoreductase, partial [Micromonospora sp. CPCC 205711]|uniref:type I polyketide synthase n=1 Tax=Micromonospora sp. CPCC 205547 TaxID=3122400 RepID=UPI002FF35157